MYGILGQKQYALYYINVREYRRGNQKWTIQRNWQYRVHKKQAENKRNKYLYEGHGSYCCILKHIADPECFVQLLKMFYSLFGVI
jgi:hypothetical protein